MKGGANSEGAGRDQAMRRTRTGSACVPASCSLAATSSIETSTALLDAYYAARDEEEDAPKPRRATTAWFNRLCDQIAGRPMKAWTELTSVLLSLTLHHQQDLEKKVQWIAKQIRAGRPPRDNYDTTILIGPDWVNTALAVQAIDPRLPGRYLEDAEDLASIMFEHEHVERCCVIVVDATSPELPYLGGALLIRTDRPVPVTLFF